ncbi:MAG: flagellar motor switch protein FliN [Candidatus Cloacimonetes bacterium]|nr:flagellar motor switch protein FliN [Candidatus Cloacimonadota bacterium]
MSDKSVLSQEEIDALLQGDMGLGDMDESDSMDLDQADYGIFSAEQARMIQEVSDDCFAANMKELAGYINMDVALSGGRLKLIPGTEIRDTLAATEQIFVGLNLSAGKAGIVVNSVFGAMIASIMLQGEYLEDPNFTFGDLQLGAIGECFNAVTGKLIPALKKKTTKDYVVTAPPAPVVIKGADIPSEAALLRQKELVEILYDLNVGNEPASKLRLILSMELAKAWVTAMDPSASFPQEEAAPAAAQKAPAASASKSVPEVSMPQQNQMPMAQPAAMQQQMQAMQGAPQMDMAAMQQMMAQMQQMQAQGGGGGGNNQMSAPYSPWQFAPISPFEQGQANLGNMELLKDVSLQVTVELGRTRMPIGQILELVNGSIVELNKQAGEAVELYVQGKLIARGEVVIIDENFGIRITSIVSPFERMGGLGGR